MNPDHKSYRPITRDIFAILVALSGGEQTGIEIHSKVIGDTVGLYIKESSLYAALHRLVEMGNVEEDRKYYKLTDKGWQALKVETKTFESLVAQSKQRVINAGHGRW